MITNIYVSLIKHCTKHDAQFDEIRKKTYKFIEKKSSWPKDPPEQANWEPKVSKVEPKWSPKTDKRRQREPPVKPKGTQTVPLEAPGTP